jgi:glycogen debranching enzyme
VANRLLREDLFSGWGLRTLSSEHVSYNPLAYQLGSVWPHDTALAAAGLQRYGAIELFHKLSHSLLDAANQFEREQLPELFGGLDRADGLPMPYGRANIPQAWAAASPVLLAQLFLGLVPDAPQNRVFLNPRLPDWLPKLELSNITIGREKIAVKLSRRDGRTIIDEIENNQNLQIVTSTEKAPLWGDP